MARRTTADKREQIDAEQEAIARAEEAAALAERNRKVRLEQQQRDKELRREQQLVGLEIKTAQQRGWMESVENNARIGQYLRQRQAIMDEIGGIINPPAEPEPPPEPEPKPEYPESPKIGDPDFFERWTARRPLRSWW